MNITFPAESLTSPLAFGHYLNQQVWFGANLSPQINLLGAALAARGPGVSDVAQVIDFYRGATSLEARKKFLLLIAGMARSPKQQQTMRRALGFLRDHFAQPTLFAPAVFSTARTLEMTTSGVSVAPARPLPLPLPSPSSSLSRENLKRILTTGLREPTTTFKKSSGYRDLSHLDKRRLGSLWLAYNRFVLPNYRDEDWWEEIHPEYLEDPLRLAREVAEAEGIDKGISQGQMEKILQVHFQIRHTLQAPLTKEVQEALARFENGLGFISAKERQEYQDALIQLETVLRNLSRQKNWKGVRPIDRTRKLFPDKNRAERRGLLLLHRLLKLVQTQSSGDAIFQALPQKATLQNLIATAAKALRFPEYFLCDALGLGRAPQRLSRPAKLAELPLVLNIFNLFRIEKPWEILYKLYPRELEWAFRVRRLKDDLLVFEIPDGTDLASLSHSGFGPLLNVARIDRRLYWRDLARGVAKQLGSSVSFVTLALYGANTFPPEMLKLKAIVKALNLLTPKTPLSPADFFLAAYPTFIGLLPFFSREQQAVITMPVPRFYRPPPYPKPRRSRIDIHFRQPQLDPKGLAALVKRRRIQLGLNADQVGKKLGLHADTIHRMERDPSPHQPERNATGSQILSLVVDPKGYGLAAAEVIAAHQYTHWRNDPMIQRLVRRTFHQPVFMSCLDRRRLQSFAEYSFRTPGEILYYWRRSMIILEQTPFRFPPEAEEIARFLGVDRHTYLDYENNKYLPRKRSLLRIIEKLGVSQKERQRFLNACKKMSAHLKSKNENP